ncbi:MAG TPA: TfoX/Sxy family protein [Gemmatimonadales bacterium]|nr:TfoX/Sxy family protein [Gemmatimonadales bacterium]
MAFDEALAARIRTRLRGRKGVTEKRMFGGLAFLLNGNLCCAVRGDEMLVRVDPRDTGRALREPHTRPFDLPGRPMKGWILVRPAGLARAAALGRWVGIGVKYAGSLPTK